MDMILEKWRSEILEFDYAVSLIEPEFIEINKVILFKGHFIPESYDEHWKPFIRKTASDMLWKAENTFNHVHLSAVIESLEAQKEIGEHVQAIWIGKLMEKFPNKEFECKVEFSKDEWELMLWTKK